MLDAADIAIPAAGEEDEAAAGTVAATAPGMPPRSLPAAAPVTPPRPVSAEAQPQPASAVVPASLKPPAGGCAEVAWNHLGPGDRVTVWLAGAGPRCLVLDVVDPATGEALAYEATAVTAEGRPLAAATPPRRVVIGHLGGSAAIAKGGMLHLTPGGIAAAGEAGRWLGPVEALIVLR